MIDVHDLPGPVARCMAQLEGRAAQITVSLLEREAALRTEVAMAALAEGEYGRAVQWLALAQGYVTAAARVADQRSAP